MDITLSNDTWMKVIDALRGGTLSFSTGSMERAADGLADWIEEHLWDDVETTLDFDWDGYTMVLVARRALL
jgi:hypothetical protein